MPSQRQAVLGNGSHCDRYRDPAKPCAGPSSPLTQSFPNQEMTSSLFWGPTELEIDNRIRLGNLKVQIGLESWFQKRMISLLLLKKVILISIKNSESNFVPYKHIAFSATHRLQIESARLNICTQFCKCTFKFLPCLLFINPKTDEIAEDESV